MPEKLKIGLLGCGAIAQIAHLPALKKADNIELTTICDAAEDLAKEMATKYEVGATYTDHHKFLAEADIDAVLIPVADAFHAPLSIDAMRLGKHVLVEKPLATSIEECEEMVKVSKETCMQLQMGCMKRYDPGLQYARKFVVEEMGERLSVSGWYCDSVFHGAYVVVRWGARHSSSSQRRPSKGHDDPHLAMVMGHGVHAIDTLRFFGGDIAAVTTTVARKEQGISSLSLLEFADGAKGTFQLTCTVKMDWCEGLMIHGERGSVIADIGFPYWLRGADVKVFDAKSSEYRQPAMPDSDPYERQIEAFAAAILTGRKVSPDVEDGLADEKALMALDESSRTGQRVVIE